MKDFLALGSIVVLKGGTDKIMIISRAMVVKLDNKKGYIEYGGCRYPQGMIDDKIIYFNGENIQETVFEGYRDEQEKWMNNNIVSSICDNKYEMLHIEELQGQKQLN